MCDDLLTPEKFPAPLQSDACFLMAELVFPWITNFLLSIKHLILADGAASKTFLLSLMGDRFLFFLPGLDHIGSGKESQGVSGEAPAEGQLSHPIWAEVLVLRLRVTFLSLNRLFWACFSSIGCSTVLTDGECSKQIRVRDENQACVWIFAHYCIQKYWLLNYNVQFFKANEIEQVELFSGLLSLFLFNLISAICHGNSEVD